MEEADGDAMCYKVIERERKGRFTLLFKNRKKARLKRKKKNP